MNVYLYKDLEIEIINELTYSLDSTDNNFNYSNYYWGQEGELFPVSKHGIKIYKSKQLINNCMVIAYGGATTIHDSSSLIDKDNLLLCCSNMVFCLSLPELALKWSLKADYATCFQIFKLENDYIIHGELCISRISSEGIKKWQFSGNDIFMSLDNKISFSLKENYIELKDFANEKYKLDLNGKLIE